MGVCARARFLKGLGVEIWGLEAVLGFSFQGGETIGGWDWGPREGWWGWAGYGGRAGGAGSVVGVPRLGGIRRGRASGRRGGAGPGRPGPRSRVSAGAKTRGRASLELPTGSSGRHRPAAPAGRAVTRA